MEKLQKATFWTLILSESTHILCCVLPTLVSIISLLSGAGALTYLPNDILRLHDFLHHWEVPMILFSAVTLALGWFLHYLSNRMNCVETANCCHTPCAPKKTMTFKIMVVATALFIFNVAVYFIFHAGKTHF
jgi:hypothetical protein